jgi:tetratricopeptide (TPR) repeat protein
MAHYTLRDVERLIGLSRAVVQGFVDAGFVAPARGKRNELRFSFQDLILLRTAQGLAAVKIPTRKIKQSLTRLRAALPQTLPLSGIRISALGSHVVVRQGDTQWHPDSGQCLLEFDVAPAQGDIAFLQKPEPPPREAEASAEHWFTRGCDLEEHDAQAAQEAYRRVLEHDPHHLAAYLNLGCLLQAAAQPAAAERIYRKAIEHIPAESLLHYNLGIALEDLSRPDEAIRAYEQAIALDPEFADAHYNVARLHEAGGRDKEAIRYYASFRRLQKATS